MCSEGAAVADDSPSAVPAAAAPGPVSRPLLAAGGREGVRLRPSAGVPPVGRLHQPGGGGGRGRHHGHGGQHREGKYAKL